MKRASLLAAAIVLIADAFALVHAWRNRSGPPETEITLTQRELAWQSSRDEDDSEIALNLRWSWQQAWREESQMSWLDQKTLQELGFDTSVGPSDKAAQEFYQRQRARRAFVALELDGPAWRRWIDEVEKRVREQTMYVRRYDPKVERESATRLIAIDASRDALKLRARHPDRGSIIIVPAVIAITFEPFYAGRQNLPERPARVIGSIVEIPSSIHVPRPHSDYFRREGVRMSNGNDDVTYRVRVRYGASLEPWIGGVEIHPTAAH